jgi:hypothetical protein
MAAKGKEARVLRAVQRDKRTVAEADNLRDKLNRGGKFTPEEKILVLRGDILAIEAKLKEEKEKLEELRPANRQEVETENLYQSVRKNAVCALCGKEAVVALPWIALLDLLERRGRIQSEDLPIEERIFRLSPNNIRFAFICGEQTAAVEEVLAEDYEGTHPNNVRTFPINGYIRRWATGAVALQFMTFQNKGLWISRLEEKIGDKRAAIKDIKDQLAIQEKEEQKREQARKQQKAREKAKVADFLRGGVDDSTSVTA